MAKTSGERSLRLVRSTTKMQRFSVDKQDILNYITN